MHLADDLGVYWFVGASYNNLDQTDRFLKAGIWENGYVDKNLDVVRSMKPGDYILIKSTYTRKHELRLIIEEIQFL